ncbi:MAG TPA: VOC family protein [Bacillota bacterium]|nr:VOC family protein [Bacillota bacterium]
MNNVVAYFEIQATEPETLKTFYGKLFGWKFTPQQDMPVPYWSIETGDDVRGGLLRRTIAAPPAGSSTNAYTCSIMVERFDEMAKYIVANGGKVAMEKFAVPGKCWQGYFLDPDNNTFGIFQPDPDAK